MANITTTELNDSIPVMFASEALGILFAESVLVNVVNRDYDAQVREQGQSVSIPFLGSVSANAKAANTAITLNAPTDSKVTVTLNQHQEVSFLIEDFGRIFTSYDAVAAYAQQGARALATKIETDLAALYSGLSQTINATSGLTEGHFREARRLLNAAKAPTGGRWAILHEDAESEALAIEKLINKDYASSDVVPSGSLGSAFGFQIAMSQNVAVSSTQCKNLFIQRDAFVLVSRPLPTDGNGIGVRQVVMQENGIAIRVTMSYDHDNLGMKVTLDTLYGLSELRDSHGVAVSTAEA